MPARKLIIAIDGPVGSGKSTVARRVAESLGYSYLDSGAMYRALALAALRASVSFDDIAGLERLTESTRIDFERHSDGQRVRLHGEDVTDAIRAQVRDAVARGASQLIEEALFAASVRGTPYLAPAVLVDIGAQDDRAQGPDEKPDAESRQRQHQRGEFIVLRKERVPDRRRVIGEDEEIVHFEEIAADDAEYRARLGMAIPEHEPLPSSVLIVTRD